MEAMQIARVAYEAARAYNEEMQVSHAVPWDAVTDDGKAAMETKVVNFIRNPYGNAPPPDGALADVLFYSVVWALMTHEQKDAQPVIDPDQGQLSLGAASQMGDAGMQQQQQLKPAGAETSTETGDGTQETGNGKAPTADGQAVVEPADQSAGDGAQADRDGVGPSGAKDEQSKQPEA